MPVKMRLRRMGAKHQPSYRIVIADSRAPRDGRYLDQVGFYNPLVNPAIITIDQEKAVKWLRQGAQPTETVERLLSKYNINPSEVRKGKDPQPVAVQTPPTTANVAQARPSAAATATAEQPAAGTAGEGAPATAEQPAIGSQDEEPAEGPNA